MIISIHQASHTPQNLQHRRILHQSVNTSGRPRLYMYATRMYKNNKPHFPRLSASPTKHDTLKAFSVKLLPNIHLQKKKFFKKNVVLQFRRFIFLVSPMVPRLVSNDIKSIHVLMSLCALIVKSPKVMIGQITKDGPSLNCLRFSPGHESRVWYVTDTLLIFPRDLKIHWLWMADMIQCT